MIKVNKNILTGIFICATALVSVRAVAVTNDGCSDSQNNRIIPELALCSTHVYNIGRDTNDINSAERQAMRDVVALKTTLITQQLQYQYDYLDATLRRLKTQLEKAVLTTKLQAAGAATTESSTTGFGGAVSTDKNIIISGARNCQMESGGTVAVLKCLQGNINLILNAASTGNNGDAQRQLDKDLSVAQTWGAVKKENNKWQAYVDDKTWSDMESCNKANYLRDEITNCAYELNAALTRKIEAYNRTKNNTRDFD